MKHSWKEWLVFLFIITIGLIEPMIPSIINHIF